MRRSVCCSILWLLGTAAPPQLPRLDRVRLAEAFRLADEVCEDVWPGWGRTPFGVLLVTDSIEFLVGHSRPSADFARQGYDSLMKQEVWTRPRQFLPTLLATFPAVSGIPTSSSDPPS